MLVMFLSFFLSPGSLRAPSTDRLETLPHDRKLVRLDKFSPKIRGGHSPQNGGGKNMQNFGQFWTTSDFDREYLRNDATYPNWKEVRTSKIHLAFDEKRPVNFGPLTAWNYMRV